MKNQKKGSWPPNANLASLFFTAAMIFIAGYVSAQNVGIGTNAPANKLTVSGTLSVGSGSNYTTTAAPTDGAIIQGRVGIGNYAPNGAAILDLTNTSNYGLVLPQIATTSLPTPTAGMVVYNSTTGCMQYYNGNTSAWVSLGAPLTGTGAISVGGGYIYFGCTQSSVSLALSGITGATSYAWTVTPSGAATITNANTAMPTVTFAGTLGNAQTCTFSVVASGCSGSLTTTSGTITYGGTQSYSGTGAGQNWPPSPILASSCGVNNVYLTLWGAGGAGGYNGSGGSGGYVTGTLPVTAATTYNVLVGTGGGVPGGIVYDGGYGGGGNGGTSASTGYGGGGGGRTAIQNSAGTVDYITVGGGGGGGAYSNSTDGGGANGSSTTNASGGAHNASTNGIYGTNTAGGNGGTATNAGTGGGSSTSTGGTSNYNGGNGGNGGSYSGGGGGGGYYGGGGGSGGNSNCGGGGGGSNYVVGLTTALGVVTNTSGNVKTDGTTANAPNYTNCSSCGYGASEASSSYHAGGNGYAIISW